MLARIASVMAAGLVLTLTACDSDDGSSRASTSATASASGTPTDSSIQSEKLTANRLKWSRAVIAEYRYRVSIQTTFNTFGRESIIMTVHGVSVSMTHSDGTPFARIENGYDTFRRYSTIDRTFDAVAQDLATAYKVTVSYDPIYGYPTQFGKDEDLNTTDDEASVLISGFEVLE